MTGQPRRRRASGGATYAVPAVTAAALCVDAYEHLRLAPGVDALRAQISQGTLFRIVGVAALIMAAVTVIYSRVLAVHVLDALLAGTALGAVVLYSYYRVGRLGPLPDMYQPFWSFQKSVCALADAVALIGAGISLAVYVGTTPARRVG